MLESVPVPKLKHIKLKYDQFSGSSGSVGFLPLWNRIRNFLHGSGFGSVYGSWYYLLYMLPVPAVGNCVEN
jgi:hypothetical protein